MATSTITTKAGPTKFGPVRADRARRSYPVIRAALLTPDLRGQWGTVCQHGHREAWPSRAIAQIALRHPEEWAPCCAPAVTVATSTYAASQKEASR